MVSSFLKILILILIAGISSEPMPRSFTRKLDRSIDLYSSNCKAFDVVSTTKGLAYLPSRRPGPATSNRPAKALPSSTCLLAWLSNEVAMVDEREVAIIDKSSILSLGLWMIIDSTPESGGTAIATE